MRGLLRHSQGKRGYNIKPAAFIKKYDVFISYSHNCYDNLARLLYGQLVDQGFSVWWDCASLGNNNNCISEIQQGIKLSDNLLLLISKAALKSSFVKAEWTEAIRCRKNIVLGFCTNTSLRIPFELWSFPSIDLSTISVRYNSFEKLCKIVSERKEITRFIKHQ
jgi:hypothetical protein